MSNSKEPKTALELEALMNKQISRYKTFIILGELAKSILILAVLLLVLRNSNVNKENLSLVKSCVGTDETTFCKQYSRYNTGGAVGNISIFQAFSTPCYFKTNYAETENDEALFGCIAGKIEKWKIQHPTPPFEYIPSKEKN